jgi:hypothetical protein
MNCAQTGVRHQFHGFEYLLGQCYWEVTSQSNIDFDSMLRG